MRDFTYNIDDTYPDIIGTVSYSGPVDTESITAILTADGATSGVFAGAVTMVEFVSLDNHLSTFTWLYPVLAADTVAAGQFDLNLVITHADASTETLIIAAVTVENYDA